MDFDLVAGVALDAIKHLQTTAPARAFEGVIGIGNLLQLLQNKARHHDQALDKVGFDQVSNAPINNDTGIQQQEVVRFVLRRESDIGDDEREVLLVAAHRQHDANIAEAEKQAQANQPASGLLLQ